MIRRYIFGPTIGELPSTVRNEINCRNNDGKHEGAFHNKDKTNNIVASASDKVINLEEQDAGMKIRERNASKKNIACVQNKMVENVSDSTDNGATHVLNNNQVQKASSEVAPHPTNTNNCSTYNIKSANTNEMVHQHDPGIESDCLTVNGLSTHYPTEVIAVVPEGEKVVDNHKIANKNNNKLSSMELDEVIENNLETNRDGIKGLSDPSSNEKMNTLNGYKDLERTPPRIDGEFTKNLHEEEQFSLEIEDAEVAAALAALEAATAGEDDELEDY